MAAFQFQKKTIAKIVFNPNVSKLSDRKQHKTPEIMR